MLHLRLMANLLKALSCPGTHVVVDPFFPEGLIQGLHTLGRMWNKPVVKVHDAQERKKLVVRGRCPPQLEGESPPAEWHGDWGSWWMPGQTDILPGWQWAHADWAVSTAVGGASSASLHSCLPPRLLCRVGREVLHLWDRVLVVVWLWRCSADWNRHKSATPYQP